MHFELLYNATDFSKVNFSIFDKTSECVLKFDHFEANARLLNLKFYHILSSAILFNSSLQLLNI